MLIPIQYEDPCTTEQRTVYVDHDEISVIVDYNASESEESISASIMIRGTSKDVYIPLPIDKVYDIIKQAVGEDKCTIVKMSPSCYVNMKHVASISVDEYSGNGVNLLVSGYEAAVHVPNTTPSAILSIVMNPQQRQVQCNFVIEPSDSDLNRNIVDGIAKVMVDVAMLDSADKLDLSKHLFDDYDLTEIDFGELVVELEVAFNIDFTYEETTKINTVRDIYDCIVKKKKG